MPMKTKRRPSVSRKLKIVMAICLALVVVLALSGLYLRQQEVIDRNAESASLYTPPPASSSTQQATQPVAAFIGDSYTQGAGVTANSLRWSSRVARAMGWTEENFGRGGTGYLTSAGEEACGLDYCPTYVEMIEDVVAAEPDIVVVAGGLNDRWAPPADFNEATGAFFTSLRDALPDAQIIVVNPIWDDDAAPAEVTAMKPVVFEKASTIDATTIDIGLPLDGKADAIASDGGHPNDTGHALIAEAVVAALDAAGA